MTTVAFDGKKLVSDSLGTVGTRRRQGSAKKIYVAPEGVEWTLLGRKVLAFGFGGNGGAAPWIEQALTHGVKVEQPITAKDLSFQVIAVTDTGEAFHWVVVRSPKGNEDQHSIVPITGPIAVGSGATIAETAMLLGKGAKGAVKAAMRLDVHTGGDLQVYKVPVLGARRFKV